MRACAPSGWPCCGPPPSPRRSQPSLRPSSRGTPPWARRRPPGRGAADRGVLGHRCPDPHQPTRAAGRPRPAGRRRPVGPRLAAGGAAGGLAGRAARRRAAGRCSPIAFTVRGLGWMVLAVVLRSCSPTAPPGGPVVAAAGLPHPGPVRRDDAGPAGVDGRTAAAQPQPDRPAGGVADGRRRGGARRRRPRGGLRDRRARHGRRSLAARHAAGPSAGRLVRRRTGASRWSRSALLFAGGDAAPLFSLAVAAMPVAIGIAVLQHRLYEVDVLVNRALLYVLLTGVVAASTCSWSPAWARCSTSAAPAGCRGSRRRSSRWRSSRCARRSRARSTGSPTARGTSRRPSSARCTPGSPTRRRPTARCPTSSPTCARPCGSTTSRSPPRTARCSPPPAARPATATVRLPLVHAGATVGELTVGRRTTPPSRRRGARRAGRRPGAGRPGGAAAAPT